MSTFGPGGTNNDDSDSSTTSSVGGGASQPATSGFGIGRPPVSSYPGRPSLTTPGGLSSVQSTVRRAALGSTREGPLLASTTQPPPARPRLVRSLSEPRKGESRVAPGSSLLLTGLTTQGAPPDYGTDATPRGTIKSQTATVPTSALMTTQAGYGTAPASTLAPQVAPKPWSTAPPAASTTPQTSQTGAVPTSVVGATKYYMYPPQLMAQPGYAPGWTRTQPPANAPVSPPYDDRASIQSLRHSELPECYSRSYSC